MPLSMYDDRCLVEMIPNGISDLFYRLSSLRGNAHSTDSGALCHSFIHALSHHPAVRRRHAFTESLIVWDVTRSFNSHDVIPVEGSHQVTRKPSLSDGDRLRWR